VASRVAVPWRTAAQTFARNRRLEPALAVVAGTGPCGWVRPPIGFHPIFDRSSLSSTDPALQDACAEDPEAVREARLLLNTNRDCSRLDAALLNTSRFRRAMRRRACRRAFSGWLSPGGVAIKGRAGALMLASGNRLG